MFIFPTKKLVCTESFVYPTKMAIIKISSIPEAKFCENKNCHSHLCILDIT